MKKICSILIVVVMIIGMMPAVAIPAFAEVTSGPTGNCTWTLDGTELIISGNGAMGEYYTPADIPWGTAITKVTIEEGITSIGYEAFWGCSELTSITIPKSVTSIGGYAFYECTGLTSVTIPDSVTSIGSFAFYECTGLTTVTIPDSVTSIGSYAFNECTGLTSVTIPNSVTSIGDYAFGHSFGLISITIPDSVTSIGDGAFSGCTGLTSVTIPESVTSIGDEAFCGCTGLTSITIPDSVTSIGYGAFYDCSGLTSIAIGDSVTSIGSYAFDGCFRLTSIVIPDSVTSIGDDAFFGCSGLTSIAIPDSVTSIGSWAFASCDGLTSITIPDSVTFIGYEVFVDCTGLKEVECHAASISASAFEGCNNLKRIYLPAEMSLVYSSTFPNQSLQRVFFGGTQAQHEAMTIQHTNDGLLNAKWSYNETGLPDHTYTNVCDKDCNECGMMREVYDHNYDNACDAECNICKANRDITHFYGDYIYNNDATTVADGTKTRTCSVCGAKDTVAAEGTKLENSFTDVKAGKYYAEPVLWAVEKEITKGLNETTFGPDQACTRGHIVTFLWRAAGSPEPKSTTNPFTDVQEGKFYYKAVLWAVENGITKGLTDTTFGPGNTCNRGQVVAFLWRAAGCPEPQNSANPFTDVQEGKFYYKAVLWAVENGITKGLTATTFGPAKTCTRGQIVTFLYNTYK